MKTKTQKKLLAKKTPKTLAFHEVGLDGLFVARYLTA